MGLSDWLITPELARRVRFSRGFILRWLRQSVEGYPYPDDLRAKPGVHYVIDYTYGRKGKPPYRWNTKLVTQKFLKRVKEFHRARQRQAVSRPRGKRLRKSKANVDPQPSNPNILIWCPWKKRYLSQKECQACWCNKPDEEKPKGYTWQDHCQRGIPIEDMLDTP